jgi:hypothetical protein
MLPLMSTAIITGVFGVVTVLVPTLIALGSGPRRHLKLIQEETATLNALPEDDDCFEARERMAEAVARQIDLYALRTAPNVTSAKFLRQRLYWSLAFTGLYLVLALLSITVVLNIEDVEVRGVVFFLTLLAALVMLVFASVNIAALRKMSREWRDERRASERLAAHSAPL